MEVAKVSFVDYGALVANWIHFHLKMFHPIVDYLDEIVIVVVEGDRVEFVQNPDEVEDPDADHGIVRDIDPDHGHGTSAGTDGKMSQESMEYEASKYQSSSMSRVYEWKVSETSQTSKKKSS